MNQPMKFNVPVYMVSHLFEAFICRVHVRVIVQSMDHRVGESINGRA